MSQATWTNGSEALNEGMSVEQAYEPDPLALAQSGLRRGVWGGGKTGSICHFAFSLVLQRFGVPRYPDAGKNSTKSVVVTPLFVCPKC